MPWWDAVAHARRTPLEGPFHKEMALSLALVRGEIYSKKLNY
jgi:hypothetical protein